VSDPDDAVARPALRMPADQRRQQLFEVARERFAQQGFHATSMDEIAEAAGVTKPVLYQHFPSKRALYVDLLEETGRQLLSTLAEATEHAESLRDRVEIGFRAYFRFAVGDRSAFLFLLGTSLRSDPEFARIVEEILDAAAETIATLIEIPAPEEQRQMLATAIVGMAESVGRRALRDPAAVVDGDQLAQWISELAWFGFRGVRTDTNFDD
jgi:AcrR family transcriptional regulator